MDTQKSTVQSESVCAGFSLGGQVRLGVVLHVLGGQVAAALTLLDQVPTAHFPLHVLRELSVNSALHSSTCPSASECSALLPCSDSSAQSVACRAVSARSPSRSRPSRTTPPPIRFTCVVWSAECLADRSGWSWLRSGRARSARITSPKIIPDRPECDTLCYANSAGRYYEDLLDHATQPNERSKLQSEIASHGQRDREERCE